MNRALKVIVTPEQNAEVEIFRKAQREEILKGKLTIRWSQACCGFRIWSGRSPVLGLESFTTQSAASDWLLETHNITHP